MKYYNFHTMIQSIKDLLREHLKNNNIYFELSGTTSDWYFVILTDPDGAAAIDLFLENNVFKGAI